MPEGIFIPATIDEPLRLFRFERLEQLQEAVGGYIETLSLPTPPETSAILVINEEGKLGDYELNQRATLLLWIHNRTFLNHDEIQGDAIVVGPADRLGNLTNVPAELTARLLHAKSLRIEIGVSIHEPRTLGRGTFKSWVSAYIFAADILSSFANLEWVKIDHD